MLLNVSVCFNRCEVRKVWVEISWSHWKSGSLLCGAMSLCLNIQTHVEIHIQRLGHAWHFSLCHLRQWLTWLRPAQPWELQVWGDAGKHQLRSNRTAFWMVSFQYVSNSCTTHCSQNWGLEIVADVLETEVLQLEIMEFHHRISASRGSASKISESTRIFSWLDSVWRYSPDTLFDLTVWLHFHKALLFQQKPTEDGSMVHGSVKPVRFCLDCVLWETLEETRKLQSNAIKDIIFSNNSRSHQLLNPSFFEANGLESGSKADMLRMIEKSAFGSQLVGRGFSSGIRLDCWSDW